MSRLANASPLRQRAPATKDPRFLRWLHDQQIECIACLIESGGSHNTRLEACHQHMDIPAKGWFSQRGKRVSDKNSVILCAWHHRLAPDACDVNQRAFWDRLKIGDDVADLCSDLFAAYQHGQDGAAVIRRWARR